MTTTSSSSVDSLPCPPRYGTPRNLARPSLGGKVAEVMVALGRPPTPWQRHVLDVALELEPVEVFDRHGVLVGTEWRLFYREVRLWVPRQSGKTLLLAGLMTHRCNAWDDQRVMYTAQTRNHAKGKLVDEHIPLLKRSRRFSGRCRERLSNGSEALLWPSTGSRWFIESTTKKAGHGDSVDLVVADEFFAQTDDRIEAGARPTMITRVQPQIWFVSTFGDDDSQSDVPMGGPLWAKVDDSRERCRSGRHGRVASFEWSAADEDSDGIDYSDRALWRSTMPALQCNGGIISEDAVAADFQSMSLAAFKRAYLNLRPRKREVKMVSVIHPDRWGLAEDRASRPDGRVVLTVDVAPGLASAALGVVGKRADGRWHGQVDECGPGVGWVLGRVGHLLAAKRPSAIGVEQGGPVASLIPDLEQLAARHRVELVRLSGPQYAAACGAFVAEVDEDRFRHLGQAALSTAAGAGKRKYGPEQWVWDRLGSLDVCPIVAVTVGVRAWLQVQPSQRRSAYEDDGLMVV